jgi:secondary thiamine-phosphate synthase enzyme
MVTFTVSTKSHEELVDITVQVARAVSDSGMEDGICLVYTPHTTAAITINENADPSVRSDMVRGLRSLKMEAVSFEHMEGNSPAHVKSSLVGCSESIPVVGGKLALGTWQGVFFCEFDGPRTRKVLVTVR